MKKEIEKKGIQEKKEPQEIKFKFELGHMIFDLGDRQFFLKEEQASLLFGQSVGIRFEQLRVAEKEDFSDLNTSDFIAKFTASYEFYGNIQGAAKYLKIDEQRLKRWMSDGESTRMHNKLAIYDGKFEYDEAYKKYKVELFGEEKEGIKRYDPNLKTTDKVAHLVMDGLGPREIAGVMKVDYSAFIDWFTNKESQSRIQLVMRNKQGG